MTSTQTHKEGEQGAFNQKKRDLFLSNLAESSNVKQSAERASISSSTAYKARREDPEFARQWLAALYEGYLHLEMEVLRRLREGDMQAGEATKYDFANATRLLAAHRDNAARAHAEQRNVSATEVRTSIDRKVKALRDQVRAERQRASSRDGRKNVNADLDWLINEDPKTIKRVVGAFNQAERNEFAYHWRMQARDAQLPPDGSWRRMGPNDRRGS